MDPPGLSYEEYTMECICALPAELAAAKAMPDEIHHFLPRHLNGPNNDCLGRIGEHNIRGT
jgi:hypothetical protein